jgi:copper transport protein
MRLLVASFVMATAALVGPARAGAAASFDFSLPTNGAIVAEPISVITVGFTEEVTLVGNGFEVIDPDQQTVLPTPITDDDKVFRLLLDTPIANGPVGVRYEVTGLDGRSVSGGFVFTVDAPVPTTTIPPTTVATTLPAPTTAPATTVVALTTATATSSLPPGTMSGDDGSDDRTGIYIAITVGVALVAGVFVALRVRTSA